MIEMNVNRPKSTGVSVDAPTAKVVTVNEAENGQVEVIVQFLDAGKVFTTERFVINKPAQFDSMIMAALRADAPDEFGAASLPS